jgi:hypothetical protein
VSDIVAFLRAQLVEDERVAQKLMRFAQDTHLTFQDHKRFLGRDVPGWHTWPDVEAMCGRVLAEIEAKRELIDSLLVEWGHMAWLRIMAQPYADREGWDKSWQ